jgi:hypothetical protein
MKVVRVFLLVIALASVLAAGTAQAADPPSGTLSRKTKSVKWSGTFVASEPSPVAGCLGGSSDPICDHYLLKVNLPDGARIRIDLPAPSATTDLDLFVYAPTGGEVGNSGNLPGEAEFVEFRHSARYTNKPYEILIRPWIVAPGTTYTATAKVR